MAKVIMRVRCVIIGTASGTGEACAGRFADRDILLLADINATYLDKQHHHAVLKNPIIDFRC